MFISKNHEKLSAISEIVHEEVSRHLEMGGAYHDDTSFLIAAKAIKLCMPELVNLSGERVVMQASRGISIELQEAAAYDGIAVSAKFERVCLQQLIEQMGDEENQIQIDSFDLCAVMRPVYLDPDPKDLVFGDELYVPFGAVEQFEAAS